MFAYLIDSDGELAERLNDVPVGLTSEETNVPCVNFPVASTNTDFCKTISVKIIDIVIESGARIKALGFTSKDDHEAVLRYMGRNITTF